MMPKCQNNKVQRLDDSPAGNHVAAAPLPTPMELLGRHCSWVSWYLVYSALADVRCGISFLMKAGSLSRLQRGKHTRGGNSSRSLKRDPHSIRSLRLPGMPAATHSASGIADKSLRVADRKAA